MWILNLPVWYYFGIEVACWLVALWCHWWTSHLLCCVPLLVVDGRFQLCVLVCSWWYISILHTLMLGYCHFWEVLCCSCQRLMQYYHPFFPWSVVCWDLIVALVKFWLVKPGQVLWCVFGPGFCYKCSIDVIVGKFLDYHLIFIFCWSSI